MQNYCLSVQSFFIDKYVSGTEGAYIADEYVLSVRDISEEEIKQFEKYKKL